MSLAHCFPAISSNSTQALVLNLRKEALAILICLNALPIGVIIDFGKENAFTDDDLSCASRSLRQIDRLFGNQADILVEYSVFCQTSFR